MTTNFWKSRRSISAFGNRSSITPEDAGVETPQIRGKRISSIIHIYYNKRPWKRHGLFDIFQIRLSALGKSHDLKRILVWFTLPAITFSPLWTALQNTPAEQYKGAS